MAKPAGDGSDVDAGAEKLARDEVPQVVEPHVRQSCLDAQPLEAAGHGVRVPRLGAVAGAAEHERVLAQRRQSVLWLP
jgi:hypothetical protein